MLPVMDPLCRDVASQCAGMVRHAAARSIAARSIAARSIATLSIATLSIAAVALPALAATALEASPAALAGAMRGHPAVMLGEVHDNAAQHALRAAALEALIAGGARPALAFEQFDRERQADIERARRERPADADYLIARARGNPSWQWEFYRPFVQLALDYDLPIVAANLSRADAMKIGTGGWETLPDGAARDELLRRALPDGFLLTHEQAIAAGHCDLLPASALPAIARAQIARDAVLAAAIRPHIARGVVLLTGNGHARKDVGVPFWLAPGERAGAVSIGLLERGGTGEAALPTDAFDAYVVTERAERPDPCADLAKQLRHGSMETRKPATGK
jgi:uncharacterized iron-regulated protein